MAATVIFGVVPVLALHALARRCQKDEPVGESSPPGRAIGRYRVPRID